MSDAQRRLDGTLSLLVDGQQLTGWDGTRVTRGVERIPSDFDISLTEAFPGQSARTSVEQGQSCQVMIGGDLVLTGYIDRVERTIGPRSHRLRVTGRSSCQDIVDCSVTPDVINGNGIASPSLLDLATRLCKPFGKPPGITVSNLAKTSVALPVSVGNSIPAILTETPYQIIERVARYLGVLVYDGPDGNLVIADVATSAMSSGFQEGVNVQSAGVSLSQDQRYSEYLPCLMAVNFFGQDGVGGMQFPKAFDPGVKRFRPLIIVSEQFQIGQSLAEKRAQWEAARRAGRSQAMQVVCDSWRDSAGRLWEPNASAPISLPSLKLTTSANDWIIGSVSFVRDADRGTVADLLMMPKAAFQPEPTILVPILFDPTTAPPLGPAHA